MSLCVAQERIFLPILLCIIYGPAIKILSFIYATVFSSLAATSWWSSFHKIWQQSDRSAWLGFSSESIFPPLPHSVFYFCLRLQQVFLLSLNFSFFNCIHSMYGSFTYVGKGKFSSSMQSKLVMPLESYFGAFLCSWVVCWKKKGACRFIFFCGWLALSQIHSCWLCCRFVRNSSLKHHQYIPFIFTDFFNMKNLLVKKENAIGANFLCFYQPSWDIFISGGGIESV